MTSANVSPEIPEATAWDICVGLLSYAHVMNNKKSLNQKIISHICEKCRSCSRLYLAPLQECIGFVSCCWVPGDGEQSVCRSYDKDWGLACPELWSRNTLTRQGHDHAHIKSVGTTSAAIRARLLFKMASRGHKMDTYKAGQVFQIVNSDNEIIEYNDDHPSGVVVETAPATTTSTSQPPLRRTMVVLSNYLAYLPHYP